MTVIDKTATSGQRVQIRIEPVGAALYLDGRKVAGGPFAPVPLTRPQGAVTHWLGNSQTRQAAGLTTEEAQRVKAALRPAVRRRVDPAVIWVGAASMDAEDSVF